MGFTSIVYAWTSSLGSRLPDAWELFSYALSNARELRDPRLLCDALIGRASIGLYMGRTQDLLAEIEEVQGICATLYFPAFLGLCEEVKGGLRLLDHDFASACKHFSRAEAIYAQNYLSAAWGFLVHVHHAEALLWLYDQPSQSGLLVRELRQLSKRASIALHRPVFAGFLDLIHACIHARRGRRDRALALLDRAVAVSSAHPFTALPSPHIFHAIIVQRAAVERARLGDPPSVVGPLFERAARITNDAQAYGLRDWIVQIHRRVLPADG